MAKEDVKRYIELEAPKAGVIANDVSELVCHHQECDQRIEVDPSTLVLEDQKAVETWTEELKDPEDPMAGTTGFERVEVYCSPECRNQGYS